MNSHDVQMTIFAYL